MLDRTEQIERDREFDDVTENICETSIGGGVARYIYRSYLSLRADRDALLAECERLKREVKRTTFDCNEALKNVIGQRVRAEAAEAGLRVAEENYAEYRNRSGQNVLAYQAEITKQIARAEAAEAEVARLEQLAADWELKWQIAESKLRTLEAMESGDATEAGEPVTICNHPPWMSTHESSCLWWQHQAQVAYLRKRLADAEARNNGPQVRPTTGYFERDIRVSSCAKGKIYVEEVE